MSQILTTNQQKGSCQATSFPRVELPSPLGGWGRGREGGREGRAENRRERGCLSVATSEFAKKSSLRKPVHTTWDILENATAFTRLSMDEAFIHYRESSRKIRIVMRKRKLNA